MGIIAAFVIQRGQRQALRPIWLGVAGAVALSGGAAVALHAANRALTLQARETMEGVLALVAVGGITYMIVWMRRHSAQLKTHLEDRAASALTTGSVTAIAGMAFVAVLREGLETAVFLLATFENVNSPLAAASGAGLGIVTAVALGYGIYRGGVRINLRRFFRITGVVLVVVAAGLLSAAVHEFAEAGLITTLQAPAVDLTWLVAPGTVWSAVFTALFGFQAVPTVAEVLAWALFLIPMVLYVSGVSLRRPELAV